MSFLPIVSDFIASEGLPAKGESWEAVEFAVHMFDHVMSEEDLVDHVRRFSGGDGRGSFFAPRVAKQPKVRAKRGRRTK